MDPVLLMITELLPRVTEMQKTVPKSKLTGAIIDYLRAVDFGKVLPPQPEAHARKFKVRLYTIAQWTIAKLLLVV